ncbi:DUF7373 family lipoprotein [Williamsia deligens]|uniref:Lipoprotein n=1 Tax=Williamsia deligens TaxID=321325 RepID=A0ABW3G6S2_9NOCA|nr:hypothetical protein [Williamsia deligens]MCP2193424.1 hypothetical protein [Williamsia deligens]
MRMRVVRLACAVTAAALLCGACGEGGRSGSATDSGAPSSSAVPSGEVDIAALDTGTYQKTPSRPFAAVTGDDIVPVEGQRMAEFTVVPFEIDSDATRTVLPTEIIRSRANISAVVGKEAAFVPANEKFLAGFVSAASTPTLRQTDPSRTVIEMVIRYADPATATTAAQQMSTAFARQAGATRVTIPGAPDTVGVRVPGVRFQDKDPNTSLSAFTAHNDYVVYTWSSTPPAEEPRQVPAIQKALALQVPLLDRFPKTPTRSQNGGRTPSAQVDANRILIYALPNPKADAVNGTDRAVYGPRGIAHISGSPDTVFRALTAAGAEHNAYWLTSVYRASTGTAAERLRDTLVTSSLASGWTRAPSPRGLPIATCLTRDASSGSQNSCVVVVGRYVGESNDESATAAAQQISAQYLVLTQADQNAN